MATDMLKSAMVYERPFRHDAGPSGRSFVFDADMYLWARDNSPPDGGVGAIGSFEGRQS